MQKFEYRVVPAPRRAEKARGVKTTEERFALALSGLMNTLGAEGWEYLRADILPCDERSGLTGTKTSFQNMLVFRRVLQSGAVLVAGAPPVTAHAVAAPALAAPVAASIPVAVAAPAPAEPVASEPSLTATLDADAASPEAGKAQRLGAALKPQGSSPAIGPARPEVAAE